MAASGHIWDDIVPESERRGYEASGLGKSAGLGKHPILFVVDVTYEFTGDRDEPIEESRRRFPLSCGPAAWQALPRIRVLLDAARAAHVPVFYTRQAPRPSALIAGSWAGKNARVLEPSAVPPEVITQIPTIIEPQPGELVIDKDKPSAFFGTPVLSYLIGLGVDSLIIAGTSTSGCVRATVVDAFSYNYQVLVAQDATFDRSSASHKVNLFDMQAKYADVLTVAEIAALLTSRGQSA